MTQLAALTTQIKAGLELAPLEVESAADLLAGTAESDEAKAEFLSALAKKGETAAEVAAAVGLIVPGLTRIKPWLVPLAAALLLPIMIGATVSHLSRGEYGSSVTTTLLLVLLAAVAYMRWKVRPIPAR